MLKVSRFDSNPWEIWQKWYRCPTLETESKPILRALTHMQHFKKGGAKLYCLHIGTTISMITGGAQFTSYCFYPHKIQSCKHCVLCISGICGDYNCAWLLMSSLLWLCIHWQNTLLWENHNVLSTVMLQWFVDSQVAEYRSALKEKKIVAKCEVEVWPNCVSSSCLDENVSLTSVQKYFSPDA